ncbi:MAG: type Z 30S ribosomal protein S14 [Candidatus Dojkabacteria bacterium]
MANKAAIAKFNRNLERVKNGNTHFKKVRIRNRCRICGRPRGYIGKFKICRICFRNMALNGELPGVVKYSF